LYSCDVTSFSPETQNKNNQGKQRGLFISGHGLSAQPRLKQPWFLPVMWYIPLMRKRGFWKGSPTRTKESQYRAQCYKTFFVCDLQIFVLS
jgi:hypothetical protein